MIEEKYKNNIGSFINETIQKKIENINIAILGAGGNGGFLIEFLTRLGIKNIIIFDGDIFEESNINRQIYANFATIGKSKILACKEQIDKIFPQNNFIFVNDFFKKKYINLIKNVDIIIDAADNLSSDTLEIIRDQCILKGIPYFYERNTENGIIVNIITKKNLENFNFYIEDLKKEQYKNQTSQPAFLCSLAASITCSELIKFISNKECAINYDLIYDIVNNKIIKIYHK